MISMHSWVFKLILFAISISLPIAIISGLGLAPIFILMALPALPVCLAQKNYSPYSLWFSVTFGLFLSWAFVSCFWSPGLESALGCWVRVSLLLVLGMTMLKGVSKMNEDQKHLIQRTLSKSMLIACLLAVFEIMTQGWVITAIRNVLAGSKDAYNPDFMNRGLTFMVLMYWPFSLALHRFLHHHYKFRTMKIFSINAVMWVGFLILLAQLQSLSATVAFVLSTVVFGVLWISRAKLAPLVALAVLVGVVATPVLMRQLDPDIVMKDFKSLPPSAEHRLYIWDFVVDRADEKPYFGWGFNSAPLIPGGDVLIGFGKNDDRKLLPSHPHNQVLQIWLELGLLGLALFCWLLGYGLYALLRTPLQPSEKSAAMAALVSYLSVGYLSYGIWQYWWLSAGLICWVVMRAISSLDPHAHSRAIATN